MLADLFPEQEFRILLVCTGNTCRSAFAERLGRAYLDQVLGERAGLLRLVSAGTHAVVGSAMHQHSALALTGFGATAGDFRAQRLTESLAVDADLVLTMTRAHRREVLRIAPRGLARTFTLREAADLLRILGDHEPEGASFAERARNLVRVLAEVRWRRPGEAEDDVPDPVSGPVEAHEEAGELIVGSLLPLLARIAALVPADDAIDDTVRLEPRT